MSRCSSTMAAAVLLYAAGVASADVLVIAPAEPVVAGTTMTLELYFKNESNTPRTVTVPKVISARLSAGSSSSPMELKAREARDVPAVQLAPQSFVRLAYTGTLPTSLDGMVTLALDGLTANRILLAVRPAPSRPR